MKNEFINYMIGHATPGLLIACLVMSCFTSAVMFYVRTLKRDPGSERTPYNWSWSFFWKDTRPRMIAAFLLILLTLRIIFVWDIENTGWYILLAIITGLISDRLAKLYEKAASVSADVADKKIDEVGDKLNKTDTKVN